MAIRFHIDIPAGYVRTIVSGIVDADQVVRYLGELHAHPDFSPDLPRLVDLREIDELVLTSAQIRSVVVQVWRPGDDDGGRVALLADRDYVFGMLRMFSSLAEGGRTEYQAFRTLDRALRWLGVGHSAGGAGSPASGAPPP